jgi:hypothetical protein
VTPALSERLVVWLRLPGVHRVASLEQAPRSVSLAQRAVALGGRAIASGATELGFDFDLADHDAALSLASEACFQPTPLAAGLAVGLVAHVDSLSGVGWGRAVSRARALARAARPGELVASRAAALVGPSPLSYTHRVAARGVVGFALVWPAPEVVAVADARVPRAEAAAHQGAPVVPTFLAEACPRGASRSLLLVAPPGSGATIALDRLASESAHGALVVRPLGVDEPLGALRWAFRLRPPPAASPPEGSPLAELLAGRGLTAHVAGALVSDLVGPRGLLVVDVPAALDADTLAALAACLLAPSPPRLVVRVPSALDVPPELGRLAFDHTASWPRLTTSGAVELASRVVGEPFERSAACDLARETGRLAGALATKLRELAPRGLLAPTERGWGVRRGVEPLAAKTASSYDGVVRQAVEHLPPAERGLTLACAVAGRPLTRAELGELCMALEPRPDVPRLVPRLAELGWLVEEREHVRLASFTASAALCAQASAATLGRLHRRAADLAKRHGPLGYFPAFGHELAAGSPARALALVTLAHAAAHAAGLPLAVARLEERAEQARAEGPPSLGRTARPPAGVPSQLPAIPTLRLPVDLDERVTESADPAVLARSARKALLQGDLDSVERLLARLRVFPAYHELVERLSTFAALAGGSRAAALHRLQGAERASRSHTPPRARAKALLAYAVGQAAAGQPEAALVQALSALARAREAGDQRGEHACARFLEKVTRAAGHPEHALAWAAVARRTEAPRG